MRKLLKEVSIILPIGVIGSMLLILGTYAFKAICFMIEKLGNFFESDGKLLVIISIVTMITVIKSVYGKDTQED